VVTVGDQRYRFDAAADADTGHSDSFVADEAEHASGRQPAQMLDRTRIR